MVLEREVCPGWLRRPGRMECGDLWPTLQGMYADLTGLVLPDEMPPRERRSIDAVLTEVDGRTRIVEIDEVQHFTTARATTFGNYPLGNKTAAADDLEYPPSADRMARRQPCSARSDASDSGVASSAKSCGNTGISTCCASAWA